MWVVISIIPILVIIIYLFVKRLEYIKKSQDMFCFPHILNKLIADAWLNIKKAALAYLVILFGILFSNIDIFIFQILGGLMIVLGFQFFFWALHIRYSMLGNTGKKT